MNSVSLIGRLTRDPEVRYSSGTNQMAVARFTLAVDRQRSAKEGEPSADFISIVCFGKTAELVERYLSKGRQIGLTGRIQTGSYEKDGRRIYTTDVIADRVEFLGSRGDQSESSYSQSFEAPASDADAPIETPAGFEKLTEEDIPF
jgi:single-strand DNA-binding protein